MVTCSIVARLRLRRLAMDIIPCLRFVAMDVGLVQAEIEDVLGGVQERSFSRSQIKNRYDHM